MCLSACPSVSSSPPWIMVKTPKNKQVLQKKAPSKAIYQAFHANLFRFRSTKLIKTAKESNGAHPQRHPLPRNNASLRTIIVTIVPWESPIIRLYLQRGGVAFGRLPLDSPWVQPWQGHWSPSVTLSSPEDGERKPLKGYQTADIVWNNQHQFDIRYTVTHS